MSLRQLNLTKNNTVNQNTNTDNNNYPALSFIKASEYNNQITQNNYNKNNMEVENGEDKTDSSTNIQISIPITSSKEHKNDTNNNLNNHTINTSEIPRLQTVYPNIIKRNPIQVQKRKQKITNERKTNGYNQNDFRLTINGDFYNKYVEELNINNHIDAYITFRTKEESQSKVTCYNGTKKAPRIEISSGQLAIHGTDNDKIHSIIQKWMYTDQRFAYLIPGEYDIERISSTKANIQCKEESYFENNVNIEEFNNSIQNKLQIGSETATVTIKPRETVYTEFNAALEALDPTIKSPKQIQDIIPKRIKEHWNNKLLYWLCCKFEENQFNINNINLADFILELIPNYDIDNEQYMLKPQEDIKQNIQIDEIQKYCQTIKHIHPINPSFPCFLPSFINANKFNKLINHIIPNDCIKTSDKSYSSKLLSSNNTNKMGKISPITTITFNNIYPGLILGDEQNKLERPTYIFAGRKHQFKEYKKDISREYISQSIPRCNVCRKPGTTYSNCQRCKKQADKQRDQIKAKGKAENWTVKSINKKIADSKLPSVCNKCSRVGHKWVVCNHKPYCYLCALSHNVGDIRYCPIIQSTYIMLENIWNIQKNGGNPREYSNWQLLTNNMNDPNDQSHNKIPKSLQRDIPTLTNNNHNKNKNVNINNKPNKNNPNNTKSTDNPKDKELYENTMPGNSNDQQIHPSLRENDYDIEDNDSDDDIIITDSGNNKRDPNSNPSSNTKKNKPYAASQPIPKTKATTPPSTQRRSRRHRPKPQPPPLTKMNQINQKEIATSRSRSRSNRRDIDQK